MLELHEQFDIAPKVSLSFAKYLLTGEYSDKGIHYHSDTEISFVKEGRGVYEIGGQNFEICPGDIVLLKSFEHHVIKSVEEQPLVNMVIMANAQFLRYANETIFDRRLLPFFKRNSQDAVFRDEKIKQLFLMLEDTLSQRKRMYDITAKCEIFEIFSEAIRLIADNSGNQPPRAEDEISLKLDTVMSYIDEHILDKLMLDELAKMVDLNPAYLSHYFKKHAGIGITEYILQNRISLAVKKLQTTDMSMKDIALMCGFNNTANFNKAFRNTLGKTPTDIRKKL